MTESARRDDISPRLRLLVRVIVYGLLGIGVLLANPFGYNDATDRIMQNVIYRVIAPLYQSRAREDIVVVLLNDKGIDRLHENQLISANEWPLRYRDHANILGRIARYRPRSLFVDIYFKKERSLDDTFPDLRRNLLFHQQQGNTQFLFAGGWAHEDPTPIQEKLADDFGLSVHSWDSFDDSYPLKIADHGTVAYDLYKVACLGDSPLRGCKGEAAALRNVKDQATLSVRWGNEPAPPPFPGLAGKTCQAPPDAKAELFRQLWLGLLNDLLEQDESVMMRCPYQTVLFADDIMHIDRLGSAEEKQRLRCLLHDKMVLYGVSLDGLQDATYSPVHGQVPGVMKHAMALDNLMHYGDAYTRGASESLKAASCGIWMGMVLLVSFVQYRQEQRATDSKPAAERAPGRAARLRGLMGRPQFILMYVGLASVALTAVLMFMLFDYEPVNSLGFLGLLAVVGALMRSAFADSFIRFFRCLRQWCWGDHQDQAADRSKEGDK
jgi:CHASE2 domain-containing sensor protein